MPENNISFKAKCAGMIGNILEHYDNALFGLLAPFIAPLFFSEKDPITEVLETLEKARSYNTNASQPSETPKIIDK